MLKLLKNIILILICILGYFWIKKETIAEKWLSNLLQTEVSIGKISPKLSEITLKHIYIYNPKTAFEDNLYALEIDKAKIHFSIISILISKKIEISNLVIDRPIFSFFPNELNPNKTNWSVIWKSIDIDNTNNPISSYTKYTSKIESMPVIIKRCIFVKPKAIGIKNTPYTTIPSLEFYNNSYQSGTIPTLSQALLSLLYLSVEESMFHLNILEEDNPKIASLSRSFFESSNLTFNDSLHKKKPRFSNKPTEEMVGFIKELFFH